MWRYFNMFVIVGVVLIGVSVIGFMTHNQFVTEPGNRPTVLSSIIYLGAGILMLFNGFLSVKQSEVLKAEEGFADRDNRV